MVGGDVVLAFKPAGDEIWELVLASTARGRLSELTRDALD